MGGGGFFSHGVGRILGDVATGGLNEFAQNNPFGVPGSIGKPVEDAALLAGGAALGGPLGMSAVGSGLGGLLGGGGPSLMGGLIGGGLGLAGMGSQGGLLGAIMGGQKPGGGSGLGGLGGLLGGGAGGGGLLGSALGGSLLGLGLSKDTSIPDVQFPSNAADQQAITGEEQSLQGLYGKQNDLLKQAQDAQRQNLLFELTQGPEGEAFREKYNNLGLLNSGAFNTGLSGQFGQLEAQQEQDILGQNIAQTGSLANLDASRLSRQFGLEDVQSQYGIAKALQDARQRAAEQQSLIGSGAYLLGGGMGGGGGGGGLSPGGGGGGLLGGLGGLLGNLGSGFGSALSGLKGLFGGGGTGQPSTGDPNLDLYGGGNPFGLDPSSVQFGSGVLPGYQGASIGSPFGSQYGAGIPMYGNPNELFVGGKLPMVERSPSGAYTQGFRDPNSGAYDPILSLG